MIIITNAAGMRFIEENVHPDHYTPHEDLYVIAIEEGAWSDYVLQQHYRERLNLIRLPDLTDNGDRDGL